MMTTFKTLILAALSAAAPAYAAAADEAPLSVHVLNIQNGLPAPDMPVVLEKQESGQWKMLGKGKTDDQGRFRNFFPAGQKMEQGTYRVVFQTGDWFRTYKAETFFPEIPVVFRADGSVKHLHIPLLLSAYGYSTYRGN